MPSSLDPIDRETCPIIRRPQVSVWGYRIEHANTSPEVSQKPTRTPEMRGEFS
jgi:hypothetical protein